MVAESTSVDGAVSVLMTVCGGVAGGADASDSTSTDASGADACDASIASPPSCALSLSGGAPATDSTERESLSADTAGNKLVVTDTDTSEGLSGGAMGVVLVTELDGDMMLSPPPSVTLAVGGPTDASTSGGQEAIFATTVGTVGHDAGGGAGSGAAAGAAGGWCGCGGAYPTAIFDSCASGGGGVVTVSG